MFWEHDSSTTPFRRWLETLTITMLSTLTVYAVNRTDPFLLHSTFPWLVLVPLILAVRHGMLLGMVSAALLSARVFAQTMNGASVSVDVASWVLGCFAVSMIGGGACDAARRLNRQLHERGVELEGQLQRMQRAHQRAKTAQMRLQEPVAAAAPVCALDAELQALAPRVAAVTSIGQLGSLMLELFASRAQVREASLYRAQPGHGLLPEPLATLGANRVGAPPHSLVHRAFATKQLEAIADPDAASSAGYDVQVAVPLLTASSQVLGVVAVHQLPFMALQPEALQGMLVVAGQLATLMEARFTELGLGRRTQKRGANPTKRFGVVAPPVVAGEAVVVASTPSAAVDAGPAVSMARVALSAESVRPRGRVTERSQRPFADTAPRARLLQKPLQKSTQR